MIEKQRTLKKAVSITGFGLHSGEEVTLTILPAETNSWYKFKRTDIENSPLIEAVVENVVDISRGTTLAKEGVKVATVEHVLSALLGLKIDNALIESSACEMPILDGSAKFIAQSIIEAGIIEQEAPREYYVANNSICYQDEATKVKICLSPSTSPEVKVMVDYDNSVIIPQFAKFSSFGEDYLKEIGICRTFVFLHELEFLHNNNLIKGGSLDNAIVFANEALPEVELHRLAKMLNKPYVKVVSGGILNNVELSFNNEPARHKLLDMIGDLALVGRPILGAVVAERPGHAANVEFVKKIRSQMLKEESHELPPYVDFNAIPLYDVNQIKSVLPHRYPFQLIDKIIEMDDNHIIGVKNVTSNEEFFQGHFPTKPVMPGVLQVEAMAQVGGIYTMTRVPDPENYLTYFLKFEEVKFRKQVVPGDTIVFYLEPISPFRRGLCHMRGWAYVGNSLVMQADLLAQIIKKDK